MGVNKEEIREWQHEGRANLGELVVAKVKNIFTGGRAMKEIDQRKQAYVEGQALADIVGGATGVNPENISVSKDQITQWQKEARATFPELAGVVARRGTGVDPLDRRMKEIEQRKECYVDAKVQAHVMASAMGVDPQEVNISKGQIDQWQKESKPGFFEVVGAVVKSPFDGGRSYEEIDQRKEAYVTAKLQGTIMAGTLGLDPKTMDVSLDEIKQWQKDARADMGELVGATVKGGVTGGREMKEIRERKDAYLNAKIQAKITGVDDSFITKDYIDTCMKDGRSGFGENVSSYILKDSLGLDRNFKEMDQRKGVYVKAKLEGQILTQAIQNRLANNPNVVSMDDIDMPQQGPGLSR